MEYEKLTDEEIKKLESIEKKMKKINAEIIGMGFNVYLACSTLHIMQGSSHDENDHALQDNSMHSFVLRGWDGGDW